MLFSFDAVFLLVSPETQHFCPIESPFYNEACSESFVVSVAIKAETSGNL